MEEQAYLDLHQLEQEHWWYRGTRAVYRMLLQRYAPLCRGSVLDLGCGTGGNVELLSRWGTVIGLDPWFAALQMCPTTAVTPVQGEAEALPFCDGAFDLIAALGVVEHIRDDIGMLREIRRICRPGGRILVLTSAFMFLWSQHDEANRHVRRYTARELCKKARHAGLRVCYLSYQNVALFPLSVGVRLLQRAFLPPGQARIDMFPVPEPINTLLARLLVLEGRLMRWVSFPCGVSLVAVLER
jgi:SAM-dependent methyltransferase